MSEIGPLYLVMPSDENKLYAYDNLMLVEIDLALKKDAHASLYKRKAVGFAVEYELTEIGLEKK